MPLVQRYGSLRRIQILCRSLLKIISANVTRGITVVIVDIMIAAKSVINTPGQSCVLLRLNGARHIIPGLSVKTYALSGSICCGVWSTTFWSKRTYSFPTILNPLSSYRWQYQPLPRQRWTTINTTLRRIITKRIDDIQFIKIMWARCCKSPRIISTWLRVTDICLLIWSYVVLTR